MREAVQFGAALFALYPVIRAWRFAKQLVWSAF